MLEETKPKVERTGRIYSFASVEFIATMPNGDKVAIWSPPWAGSIDEEGYECHLDYDDPKQDAGALSYAEELWENKSYVVASEEYLAELGRWKTYEFSN